MLRNLGKDQGNLHRQYIKTHWHISINPKEHTLLELHKAQPGPFTPGDMNDPSDWKYIAHLVLYRVLKY